MLRDTFDTDTIDANVFNHILSVSPEGHINDDNQIVKEEVLNRAGISPANDQVTDIVNGIEQYANSRGDDPTRVVLFIHGGLAEESVITRRVQSIYKQILPHAYPIFVHWKSGLLDTYLYQLRKVRNGEISKYAKFNWPIYLGTDLANIVVQAPRSWAISGTHAYNGGVKRKRSEINKALESYDAEYDFVNYFGSGNLSNTYKESLRWCLASPGKVLSTPIAHAMGKPAWDEMLRRADNVVYPTSTRSIDELAEPKAEVEFSLLGSLLERLQQKSPQYRFDIIGHSMGAIVLNRLITQQPNFKFDNIVHMASADTVGALFANVFPYLRKNTESKFYSLHLHPRNEERETNLFGIAPTGSLLVYIEDMFTTPDSVMTRRSGAWDNIVRIFDRLPSEPDIRNRMKYTIFGLDEKALKDNKADSTARVVNPQKHGEFSRTRFWLNTTWEGSAKVEKKSSAKNVDAA